MRARNCAYAFDMSTIYTVGHSVLEPDEFLGLLHEHGVDMLVDVRRYPASRRVPHFNAGVLAETLESGGIGYRHAEELGGRRRPLPDSRNGGWENEGFRGYADYMRTQEFADGLHRLEADAREHSVAVMCAEAQWWRCHRRLLADALVARHHDVVHLRRGGSQPHEQTPFAVVANNGISYPPVQGSLEV
jgi:uncharacterized protein (DUF488 family)